MSSGSGYGDLNDSQLFVGRLPRDTKEEDVKDLFSLFGKIVEVRVRLTPRQSQRRSMAFAFVTFRDPRDARDAIRERDGFHYRGRRLRVERIKRAGGGGDRIRDSRDSYPRHSEAVRRSCYRVNISGLPLSGSWQDLKEHMGAAGEVSIAVVHKDGTGMVAYRTYEDMEKAVQKLNAKFYSHRGDTGYIQVLVANVAERENRSQSRCGSRSRTSSSKEHRRHGGGSSSRSRSRSRSPSHSQRSRHSHSRSGRSPSTDRSDKTPKSRLHHALMKRKV